MSHAPAIAAALLAASAALFAPAARAVPTTITYAGVLEDNGAPLNATVDVSFTIFSADSGGTVLYSEDDPGTVVLDGQLVVELGRNNLDDTVLDAPDLFLEVSVDGDALSPRVRLTSVPFALRAAKAQEAAVADALGGLAEADVVTQAQLITLHLDSGLSAGTGISISGGTVSVSSIGSAQIADGSIVDADINANAAINGAKLGTASVTGAKIANGTIDETKLARSRHIFQVTAAGCAETVGSVTTQQSCGRETSGCPSGQCRDCATNVCSACTFALCQNVNLGFLVGP